jgi:hypothetical protein
MSVSSGSVVYVSRFTDMQVKGSPGFNSFELNMSATMKCSRCGSDTNIERVILDKKKEKNQECPREPICWRCLDKIWNGEEKK